MKNNSCHHVLKFTQALVRTIATCVAICLLMVLGAQDAIGMVIAQETPSPTKGSQGSPVAVVTKLEDTDDGKCEADDCSLREAIGGLVNGGMITFADGVEGTIKLENQIQITSSIEIKGKQPKSDIVTIQAKYGNGIFRLESDAHFTISLITIAGSPDFQNSGGIYIDGGTLIVRDCTFRDNGRSAITNIRGKLDIIGSSFYRNLAVSGGAIENFDGTAYIRNSTFYKNEAASGGAISNRGVMVIQYSTFSQNTATTSQTIDNHQELTIGNSIFDGPLHNSTRYTENCEGVPFIDGGNNLQFPYEQCGITIPVRNPLLAAELADNSGPTLTLALMDGSPAIDGGDAKVCAEQIGLVDQRGMPRSHGKCDIGAYEKQ